MSKDELTHAMHDRAHCLVHGLFCSLKAGERKLRKLDIIHVFGEEEMRFVGFEPLGGDDARFMQGIVASAGPEGIVLTPDPTIELSRRLRDSLDATEEALKQNVLMVKIRIRKLLTEIGMSDGGKNKWSLKESLSRMAGVTVVVKKNSITSSCKMLSFAFDESDGRLCVALNPRITAAVLGEQPYTRIDMKEVRKLRSDPARLIHQRLCGWIDPGEKGIVKMDTLCGYVWPWDASPGAKRRRKGITRKALSELAGLDWGLDEYVSGKWEISRPSVRKVMR
ncbi:replication protein C, IncQ-type [Thermomonas paludicola]|uniref:replication protein C, IncQ-type n=1 Tax=Thermomonas paludicola TaxID=2884874 RepID=UPI003CCE2250